MGVQFLIETRWNADTGYNEARLLVGDDELLQAGCPPPIASDWLIFEKVASFLTDLADEAHYIFGNTDHGGFLLSCDRTSRIVLEDATVAT